MIIHNNFRDLDQVRFAETIAASHLVDNNKYFNTIIVPTSNDILNGRGKLTNTWHRNVFYRDLIKYYKLVYIVASPDDQKLIARCVIDIIRGLTPSGRFLEVDKSSGTWYELEDDKAIFKIRQVLREGAPELREHLTPNAIGSPSQVMSEGECKQFLVMVS